MLSRFITACKAAPRRFIALLLSHPVLVAILVLAALLRVYPIPHGIGFHPDERHLVMVTNDLERNGMNPRSFAYGSLPFYIVWSVSKLISFVSPQLHSYDGLFYTGRSVAALFGVVGVYLTYCLARALGLRTGLALLSALLLALNVFHLQLSRYFAVDIFLSTTSLLTLLACVRLYKRGDTLSYLLAGIALGLALGTKVSALNLLVPLGLACFFDLYERKSFGRLSAWLRICSLPLVALAVFLTVEPFAALDFETFLRHTSEQINMVRGDWRPPYIIQYENTAPYLYALQQMVFYTMGLPLALGCLCGAVFMLLRQFKKLSPATLLTLTWVFVTFIAFAGLKVKFPRYLLPIYPPLMICAAWLLGEIGDYCRTRGRYILGLLPALAIITASGVYAFAFERIYSFDHSYELASRWVFDRIPSGAKILSVDWDDKLPLSLPGLDARRYAFEGQQWELQVYHPESEEKLDQLATKLASAEYIVLPTARSYGALPRIPFEYPLTNHMFSLLFKGSLGYELIQTFKVRPGIGAWSINDDLADESFWVYDHPKVIIFKRTSQLPKEEIERRLRNAFDYAPLPTREDMLLKNAGTDVVYSTAAVSSLWNLSKWILLLALLAAAGAPWCIWLFRHSPDRGLGLALPLGLSISSALLWIGTSLGKLNSTGPAFWLMILTTFGSGAILYSRSDIRRTSCTNIRLSAAGWSFGMFTLGFILFLLARLLSPEVYWGEKPMDFTFLNFFTRLDTLPPQDPWASGERMRYYYFGSYVFGLLHKAMNIDTGVGYNLSIATLAGMSLSAAYSAVLAICRRCGPAIIGALFVVVVSNLEVLRLFFFGTKKSFDLFWASTRLLKEPAITEYPFWALLFADLHAHLIALAFALTLLAMLSRFLRVERQQLSGHLIAHRLLCGMLLSILFVTNSWDAISYGALTAAILVYATLLHAIGSSRSIVKRCGTFLADIARDGSLLTLGAIPICLLFKISSANDLRPHFGFNQSFEFNSLDQILRHLGIWLLPCILGLFTALCRFARRGRAVSGVCKFVAAFLLAGIPSILGALAEQQHITSVPWDILALASVLIFLALSSAFLKLAPRALRVAAVCAALGGFILAGAEIGFLMDHMNTIFKFYNAIWVLLAISTALLLPFIAHSLWFSVPWRAARYGTRALLLTLILVFALGGAGSVLNYFIMCTFHRIAGPRPTLDGMAYLPKMFPDDARAITWLRENVSGLPVIVEANGPSYQHFTRIGMNTGLPTVLGWNYHVIQRGTSGSSVRAREEAIRAIYSSSNMDAVMTYLRLYHVRYIFLGEIERQLFAHGSYDQAGLDKFNSYPEIFHKVFEAGQTQIFEVVG
ncbi:MAG: phospholipid carrier-dependent glycosyltransferase [Oligoflexia bacterium]|nr:phospholipid carrier-dependent glycosyltransferase [Oligoflexia bacterium]